MGPGRFQIVSAVEMGSGAVADDDDVPDGRPEHLLRTCDESRLALGVDAIALWQLHGRDPRVPWTGPFAAFTSSFRKYTDNNNTSFEADRKSVV